jgi:hypothetical protein
MAEEAVKIVGLSWGAEVGIAIALLAVWVLMMVAIGKWRTIRVWIKTTVFRRPSAASGA